MREVVIDLVHLQHDIIGHFGFGQKHVHVPRQTPRNRVNTKPHILARRPQLAGQLCNRLLRLCDRHAVARHDDHAIRIIQGRGHAVGVDCHLLTLDFHRRARRATKAAKDHTDKGPVHRLTHDVGQDGTRGAHERTHHDQQVVGQREANRRCRPAGIAVKHRDNDRHISPADAHDQVITDEERQKRHHDQRPLTGTAHIHDQQHDRRDGRSSIQRMPTGQLGGGRSDLARQFTKGNDRTGKGHSTDKDA